MIVTCPACDSTDGWDIHWRERSGFYGDDRSQLFIVCRGCLYEETTTRAAELLSRTGSMPKRRH